MSVLGLEGLGKTVQTGDEISTSEVAGAGLELRARREMLKNGMSLPEEQETGSKVGGASRVFSDLMDNAVKKVNEYQQHADSAVKELVAGRNKNIHETMLAVERAELSMKLMVQVRNKLLDAYREIMRMQV